MGLKASRQTVKGQVKRLQGQQRDHLCPEPWPSVRSLSVVAGAPAANVARWSWRPRSRSRPGPFGRRTNPLADTGRGDAPAPAPWPISCGQAFESPKVVGSVGRVALTSGYRDTG